MLVSLSSQKVIAQASDPVQTLRKEGDNFTVLSAFTKCIKEYMRTEFKTDNLSSELPVFLHPDNYTKVSVGLHVNPSNKPVLCTDASWTSDAVKYLGFSSNSEFMRAFYNIEDNNWTIKDEYKDSNNVVNKLLVILSQKGNPMVACGQNGKSCSIRPLSDPAKYVLYLENFYKGCGGQKFANEDDANSTDEDHRALVYLVDATGNINPTEHKVEKGLGETVWVGTGVVDDGELQCRTIIQNINELAPNYTKFVKEQIAQGNTVENLADTLAPTEDNKESCEERAKLSAGWAVCSAVELLSDGMDAMVGYIDDLLDVDVAKMDKDGEMEKSWSYFRAIASFLLLGVGLAMIISQAIGGGNS